MIATRARASTVRLSCSLLVALALLLSTTTQAQECIQDSDCADANVCNGIERCEATACVPATPIPCDDADPCTRDECEPSVGCSHVEELCPIACAGLGDGARCADGTACTVGDACLAGACVPGPPRTCSDLDACTAASCDPAFGCVYSETVVSPPCASDCTGGVADFTRCAGDDNPCTIDACLPSVDFSVDKCIDNLLLGRQCADGDVCNGDEWCSPLLGCQVNAPLPCDDDDACNGAESCDPTDGCELGTPLPDGEPCDDHRDCTMSDRCTASSCSGTPVTPADCDDLDASTDDRCHEGFGCLHCRPVEVATVLRRLADVGESNGKLRARGKAALAGAAVSPATESLSLLISSDGAEAYRASLPAGAIGLKSSGRYRFIDKTGTVANGLRVLKIAERDGVLVWSAASVRLQLAGPVETTAGIVLVVGDDCFSASLACTAGSGGTKLKCRP